MHVRTTGNEQTCPLVSMCDYMVCRGSRPGPLFVEQGGGGVTSVKFYAIFNKVLNECKMSQQKYKAHSFRIGGATYLLAQGWSDVQIKEHGRWSSNALYQYLRKY